MMKAEKGKTIKYIKEKRQVSKEVKDNLKSFNRIKKDILGVLKEQVEMTVPQLSKKLGLPDSKTLFYVMSLLKYGFIETSRLDDMDEYYFYKLKENDQN